MKRYFSFSMFTFAATILLMSLSASALVLNGVQSRKVINATSHDLALNKDALITGAVTIDSRVFGATRTVVFQFDTIISSVGAVSSINELGAPLGTATTERVGKDVLVTLSNIPNNRWVTVVLTGVNGTLNTQASIGYLAGDVDGNGGVNASDVSNLKIRSGQLASAAAGNFKYDLNTSGAVSASDISALKARTNTALPVIANIIPVVISGLADATVSMGNATSFTVEATGVAPLYYHWYHNGNPIAACNTVKTCPVTSAKASDAGTYSVEVYGANAQHVSARAAILTVQSAPSFSAHPSSIAVTTGSTATFSVTVSGNPVPTLKWERSNNNGSTWSLIANQTGSSLTLQNVQITDSGALFRSIAQNSQGNVTSNTATLTVGGHGGDVINVNGCSYAAVKAAIQSAADGSTIVIGADTCDWGSNPAITRNAGITIRGAGIDSTIIKRTAPIVEDAPNMYLMEINCANGKTVEFSHMTLLGNDALQTEEQKLTDYDSGIALRNSCKDFKVHDMKFEKFSQDALLIKGEEARGVIYDNRFIDNWKCQPEGPTQDCAGYSVTVYGDYGWPAMELGSANAVFIEDNTFINGRHNITSNYGSRYVFRHNTLERGKTPAGVLVPYRWFSPIDAHGLQGSSGTGSRSWEIYDNVFKMANDIEYEVATIGIRGGDGVLFCNKFEPGAYKFNNPGITNEGNVCGAGYPYKSQMRKAFFWQNTGNLKNNGLASSSCAAVKEGRDFYNYAPKLPNGSSDNDRLSYTPYTYPHPLRGLPATAATACSVQ